MTATQIECTMKDEPVCGTWYPQIFSKLGLIPVKSDVEKITVNCNLNSISPNTDLNVLGHDNLTLSGTNFPRYLTDNVIDIEFSNPEKSKCVA